MSNSRALIQDDLRKFEDWANRNPMKSDKKCKALTRVEVPTVNLNISQQYALIPVQAIPKCGASLRENYPLLLSSGEAACGMRFQFLVPQFRKGIEKLRRSRRSATKIFRGLKHTSQAEAVELGLVQSGKEPPIVGYNYFWRSYRDNVVAGGKTRGSGHKLHLGRFGVNIRKNHYVSNAALKQVSQSGCGISIPGSFQNLSGKRHC